MQARARILIIIAVAFLVGGLAGGLWWATSQPPRIKLDLPGLQVLDEAVALPDFTLTDHNGAPFTAANLRGAWTLLFFGYGHCPDVCPSALAAVKQALRDLKEPKTRFIFVSVDPRRDTPATLKDHVTFVDPAFVGVTGPEAAQKPLWDALGIMVEYEDSASGEPIRDPTQLSAEAGYLVQHTASLFFVDPDGQLVAYLLPPQTPQAIRQVLEQLAR